MPNSLSERIKLFSLDSWQPKHVITILILLIVGIAVRIPQLFFPLGDPIDFRKTQTAFVVREYFRNGIDLLNYPLPVLGNAQSVPMEMPIFQALATLLKFTGLSTEVSGHLVSLFMFQVSAFLMLTLAKDFFGARVAVVGFALMQFSPYSMEWGSAFLIESTALAFTLASLLCLQKIRVGNLKVLTFFAICFSVLAFLSKSTTPVGWFVGFGLMQLLSISYKHKEWPKKLLQRTAPLTIVGSSGLFAGLAWTAYADQIKSGHPLTSLLQSGALNSFNFGTIQQRLDPFTYIVFGARTWLEIMGFTLILIPVLLYVNARRSNFQEFPALLGLSVASAFGPLVFFNIYTHDYYFIPLLPAMTTLASWAIVETTRSFSIASHAKASFLMLVILLATLWTSFWGAKDILTAFSPPKVDPRAELIAKHTLPEELVVVIGCDWNPTILYHAERRGLMIPDYYIEEDVWRAGLGDTTFPDKATRFQTLWKKENLDDYAYLVVCEKREIPWPAGFTFSSVHEDFIFRIGVFENGKQN